MSKLQELEELDMRIQIEKLIELNRQIQDQLDEIKLKVEKRNTPWMDMKEASAYCKISYSSLARKYEELVPHSRITGRPTFHKNDLDEWLNKNKVEIY